MEKITYDANSTSRFKIIKRHETELKWIKLLQTPYPLGFNDNIYHEGNLSKMPDFDVFSLLEFRKRTARSHGIKKNGNCKRKSRVQKLANCTLRDLATKLDVHGRHCMLSYLSSLPISVLRSLDTEANKFYDRTNRLYDAALLTRTCEVLNKLKSRGFRASSLSTYDFSTLYTTLPHNLIKDKLVDLIERTFQREGSLYFACNDRNAFFTSDAVRNYNLWSCQKVCEALTFLLDNIYIRFGSKLYRQIVGIPMGTNCAPLVADLFLFCYERDFMLSLSEENQSGIIEAFNSTSRYLDDLLNIDNNFFDSMVNRIYPSELQLNKANVSDAEASFLDLHLSISDGFVKTKIYDKRDDFDFDTVNFPFLDGDVPRSASYGVYISQLIRFARVSSHVDDFNTRNKVLTAKLLRQGYRYHKLRKAFSKFYRRHFDIVSKYNVGLKTLLLQGLSEPEFYGDLVYKFRKIIGKIDFPYHFKKIIVRYKKIGFNINVMRQTACLVVNPIKVNSFAYLFNCTTVGRTSD